MREQWKRLSLTLSVLLLAVTAAVHAEDSQRTGTTVQITVNGNQNNVEFQVKDKNGTAVKGASIDIRNKKAEWLFYGATDSKGRKSMKMPVSTQNYRVYKSGYITKQGKFTVSKGQSKVTVKVTLEKENKPKPNPVPSRPGGESNGDDRNSGGNSGSSGGSSAGNGHTVNSGMTSNSSSADQAGTADLAENGNEKKAAVSGKKKQEKKTKKDKTVEKASEYSGHVDMALNVVRSDGTPAAGLNVELHSKIKTGTLDSNGFILIPEVETGSHVIYVKNDDGATLARKAFTISRSNVTNLEADDVVTVGAMATQITLNVEFDEDSGVKLVSAWEGLTDRNGSSVLNKNTNKAASVKESRFLKIIKQPQLWLTLILMIILLISLHFLGKRGGKREKEAKNYEYKTAWKK